MWYLNHNTLPAMLKDEHMCESCHMLETCTLYHKAFENGTRESSGLSFFEKKIGHLQLHHLRYITKWERLIDMERAEMHKNKKEIWSMSGEEREATGRCFNDMVVTEMEKMTAADAPVEGGGLFRYHFRKRGDPYIKGKTTNPSQNRRRIVVEFDDETEGDEEGTEGGGGGRRSKSFLDSMICKGDYVILSSSNGQFGIADGFVDELNYDFIVISTREELRPPPTPLYEVRQRGGASESVPARGGGEVWGKGPQQFHGVTEIEDLGGSGGGGKTKVPQLPQHVRQQVEGEGEVVLTTPKTIFDVVWRIDKEETSAGLGTVKQNLFMLFAATGGDEKRRQLVVDLRRPRFKLTEGETEEQEKKKKAKSEYGKEKEREKGKEGIGGGGGEENEKDRFCLNIDQKRAIDKVLRAEDYALILGMPGTGKTTTIAHIVRTLVARGKTVLLTAYTHTAVDNLLLKLKEVGVDFLRLGREECIHNEIKPYTIHYEKRGQGLMDKKMGMKEKERKKEKEKGKEKEKVESEVVRTVAELEGILHRKQVVATTCLGITHDLFTKRRFDYCIVDEVQCSQPSQRTTPSSTLGANLSIFRQVS